MAELGQLGADWGPERVGPFVRALSAGLEALAPNEDQVPLGECLAHLAALDPALSGEILAPAAVSARTGMPAFTWMERALAEQVVARRRAASEDPTDADLDRARALDRDLGRRMGDRRALHRHLREHRLLPTTRLEAAVRRVTPTTDVTLRYDRMAPDGRWLRIRADLSLPVARRGAGPFAVDAQGRVRVDEALQHLLTRHFATPLLALRAQLGEASEGEVLRLGRGWVGPFWFPGVQLPPEVPPSLGRGLVLHLSHEVVSVDVGASRHLDPWLPDPGEQPPEGQHIFRERRLAASAPVLPQVRTWVEDRGIRTVVVPIGAASPRRSL